MSDLQEKMEAVLRKAHGGEWPPQAEAGGDWLEEYERAADYSVQTMNDVEVPGDDLLDLIVLARRAFAVPSNEWLLKQAEALSSDKSEDAIRALAWNLAVAFRRWTDEAPTQKGTKK